jgi:PAS domain S-box-containing protein
VASGERARQLFEQSPMAIQVVDVDGRTLRVNRAWEQLWGVPFEALAGVQRAAGHDSSRPMGVTAQAAPACWPAATRASRSC